MELATRLAIQVDAPMGMDYAFLSKNLTFARLSGKLVKFGNMIAMGWAQAERPGMIGECRTARDAGKMT